MNAPSPHLRPREGGEQPTTTAELFFDLVYVFAVTQLSHLIIHDQTVAGAGRAAFLLLVVWWAWIYTTWMVNWFDPSSPKVRLVLMAATLASLLMSTAIPTAFGAHALLFAGAYAVLQVGRNAACLFLLGAADALRKVFERIVLWSVASAVLWLAGALVGEAWRLALWGPALALDLAAPLLGYWTPWLGRSTTTDYAVEGGHFAERFQAFLIIALGESIVVTGATAAGRALNATVIVALAVAFVDTAALWWLYFGEVAGHSRRLLALADDPGSLARDAYSYLHLPIVAGVIMVAVGDDLLIAGPNHVLTTVGIAMTVGGPAVYLFGESLFRLRMIQSVNPKRIIAVVALCLLAAPAAFISALALSCAVAAVLVALGLWEYDREGVPIEPAALSG
jgi:low temperature requirement protein LtrA